MGVKRETVLMSVSIIVVTYNSAEYLPACLESLAGTGAEIIVVDNASADDSAPIARARGARVIANAENRGFAAAANQGARAALGDYLLFLNPDAALIAGFEELACALESDPRAGAAAGLLVGPDGQPQVGFNLRALPTFSSLAFEVLLFNRLWPGNPVNRRYRCLDVPLDRPALAEQPAGACLLVRRSALERVGFWDERFYPLWFEDVDLCARLRGTGLHILYLPASRWRHEGAHSLSRISFAEKQFFWYRNLVRYVRKHMGSAAALAMRLLVCAGATARLLGSLVTPGGQRSLSAYGAVVKMALTASGCETASDSVNASTR